MQRPAAPDIFHVQPGDHAAVDAVLRAAFGGPDEADLTARLRLDGDVVLELAAGDAGPGGMTGGQEEPGGADEPGGRSISGCVVFSRVWVDPPEPSAAPAAAPAAPPALALAPVAVTPRDQGKGVGTALIETALGQLRAAGEAMVFVLGDPAYYRRFGFGAALAAPFGTPWPGPAFQALVLNRLLPPGRLRYAPAFGALDG